MKVTLRNDQLGPRGHGELMLNPGKSMEVDLSEADLATIKTVGLLTIVDATEDEAAKAAAEALKLQQEADALKLQQEADAKAAAEAAAAKPTKK